MAYQNRAAATNQNNNNQNNWQATAFLNLFLPANNAAGRKKLGAIKLRDGSPNEARLIAWLTEDPSRVAKLISQLQMDFQLADSSEDNGFVLPE